MVWGGVGRVREARACARWPQTEGRGLTSGSVVVGRDKSRNLYAPSVTYAFFVAGREFNGTWVTLVPRNDPSLSAVQATLASVPAGRPFCYPGPVVRGGSADGSRFDQSGMSGREPPATMAKDNRFHGPPSC